MRKILSSVAMALCLASLVACRQRMADQPRYDPLEKSSFFGDGRSGRPLVAGTVARGQLREDEHLYTGKSGGKEVDTFPFPVTKEILLRGQERYDIYCSPCHDRIGSGLGMVIRRGFRPPHSFHEEHMREAPAGHYFEAITNGFGAMSSYAGEVSPRDRWAIIAYIRALQLSQHADWVDVPEAERRKWLESEP